MTFFPRFGPLYELVRDETAPMEARMTAATGSPLALALHLDPTLRPYDHVALLDEYLVALCNLQLYPDGPGEAPEVWFRPEEGQGEYHLAGKGYLVAHSDTVIDADEVVLARPGAGPDADDEDRVVFSLAIAMPPRHGKSTLVTENLPLWFLLRKPTSSVTVATYNATFAQKWGASAQERLPGLQSKLPMAADGLPLAPITSNMEEIKFRPGKDKGSINFRGVGGSLTGTGVGLGVIDDPFKNHEDALSEVERQGKADWYTSSWTNRKTRTRENPYPVEVMMFTRWHEDDLAGRFVYEDDGTSVRPGWCALRLPAIAEEEDLLGRAPGQSLCPQLVDKAFLLKEQAQSPVWFASLYQGTPAHSEGNLFKKTATGEDGQPAYHHYLETPEAYIQGERVVQKSDCLYFMTVDLATSKRSKADWSVIGLFAWSPPAKVLILVDLVRDRVSSESHQAWALRFWRLHEDKELLFLGVENKTFGTDLINEMRQDHPEITVLPLKADRDKITRAYPAVEASNGGRLWLPRPAVFPGTVTLENELSRFPNGAHDDQVDVIAFAWSKAQDYAFFVPPTQEETKSEIETVREHITRSRRRSVAARGGPMYSVGRPGHRRRPR